MTIAQQIKWDFKANAFLVIKDTNGNLIYFEGSSGYWEKYEYDFQGNQIYYEALNGYWAKWEYDSKGNVIYYENSNGRIEDNRPKPIRELTLESLAEDVHKLSELMTRFVNQVNESNTIK
jgi:hypothetical protein